MAEAEEVHDGPPPLPLPPQSQQRAPAATAAAAVSSASGLLSARAVVEVRAFLRARPGQWVQQTELIQLLRRLDLMPPALEGKGKFRVAVAAVRGVELQPLDPRHGGGGGNPFFRLRQSYSHGPAPAAAAATSSGADRLAEEEEEEEEEGLSRRMSSLRLSAADGVPRPSAPRVHAAAAAAPAAAAPAAAAAAAASVAVPLSRPAEAAVRSLLASRSPKWTLLSAIGIRLSDRGLYPANLRVTGDFLQPCMHFPASKWIVM